MESNMNIAGLDGGTMNLIRADRSGIEIKRNVFLTISKKNASKRKLRRMGIPFVEIEDQLHLLSEDAYNYANVFNNAKLRRPMKSGLLNPQEQDALPVMRHIIGSLIGSTESNATVVYSVPGQTIDNDRKVDYHSDVLKEIVEFFGYRAVPLNEGVAIGNVGLQDHDMTGIAIGFGSGQAQCCIMYKGLSAVQFSVSKSGDWITDQVANDCGISFAKANQIKESADYTINPHSNERRSRAQQAVKTYYESLIRYVLANISAQFKASSETPTFPDEVPIVIAGGTAMVNGFVPLFKEQFTQQDFPIDVGDIQLVEEPLTAVARGCLMEAEFEEAERSDEEVDFE